MSVSFEPQEDLIFGSFELERSGQRERLPQVKQAAVSVDDALAPTDISEPVVDDEGEDEDTVEGAATAAPAEAAGGAPQNGNGKKRRRRRRGRGGSRSPQTAEGVPVESESHQAAHEQPQHAEPRVAPPDAIPATPAEAQNGGPGTSGSSHRRRRRRRKPRGGSAGGGPGTPPSSALHGDETRAAAGDDASPFDGPVTPNAPSAPVWSLGSERGVAGATHETVGEMYYRREEALEAQAEAPDQRVPEERKAAPQTAADADARPSEGVQSDQPQRRGWWQRTFRKD